MGVRKVRGCAEATWALSSPASLGTLRGSMNVGAPAVKERPWSVTPATGLASLPRTSKKTESVGRTRSGGGGCAGAAT